MIEQEILKNIEIILYNAKYSNNKPGWGFYAANIIPFGGDPEYKYHNDTVDMLRDLYQSLPSIKEREFLLKNLEPIPAILIFIHKHKSVKLVLEHKDFIFMFFIKIGELERAFKIINKKTIVTKDINQVFFVLYEILYFEPQIFDNAKLDEILLIIYNFESFIVNLKAYWEKKQYSLDGKKLIPVFDVEKIADYQASDAHMVKECESSLSNIKNRIFEIEKYRLSLSLKKEGINYEINQDKKQLQDIIKEFGFDERLNEAVMKIDAMLYNAKDPFDFKLCIDLIRSFLEKLCFSIVSKIGKQKQDLPLGSSVDTMRNARNYFRNSKINFLTQKEDELLEKLYAFISDPDNGAHALQSEKEYARISRNFVIELGLFLVEKLKKAAI